MHILSIRQPWAHLIVHGHCDILNRARNTDFRGRFLVLAGTSPDVPFTKKYRHLIKTQMYRGGIIGSVELVRTVGASQSPWYKGPIGWEVKNPEVLGFIPYINRSSSRSDFFEVNLDELLDLDRD